MSAEIINFVEYKLKKNDMRENISLNFKNHQEYENYLKNNISEEDFEEFIDARDNPDYYMTVETDIMDFVDKWYECKAS